MDIQPPVHLEAVLHVNCNVLLPKCHAVRLNLSQRAWLSEQEVQHRVTCGLSVERNRSVRVEKVKFVELEMTVIRAEGYLMAAVDDVDTIRELQNVAIEMSGGAVAAAKAKSSTHGKIDEVRIKLEYVDAGIGEGKQVRCGRAVVAQARACHASGVYDRRRDAIVVA